MHEEKHQQGKMNCPVLAHLQLGWEGELPIALHVRPLGALSVRGLTGRVGQFCVPGDGMDKAIELPRYMMG